MKYPTCEAASIGCGAPARERLWLAFVAITALFWGVWGASNDVSEKAGFPATPGYSVWSLTMILCAIVALWRGA